MTKKERNQAEAICVVVMAICGAIGGNFWLSLIMGIVWFLDIVEPSYYRMPFIRVGMTLMAWTNIFGLCSAIAWYVLHVMGHYQRRSVERLERELSSNGEISLRRCVPFLGIPRPFSFISTTKELAVFRKKTAFGKSDPQKWKRVEDAEFSSSARIWGCGKMYFESKKIHKDGKMEISGIPFPMLVTLDKQYEKVNG